MKKIIVLFGHKAVVKAAKDQGFYIINILQSDMLHSTFIKACKFADQTIVINDLLEIETVVKGLAAIGTIDGVVSFTDTRNGVLKAAELTEKYFPNNHFVSVEAVNMLLDKKKMRDYLHSLNLKRVPNAIPKNLDDVRSFLEQYGNAIVKPINGQASCDIFFVSPEMDLQNIWDDQVFNRMTKGCFIIEKFILGQEYSVETLTDNGNTLILGVTDKYKIPKKMGHSEFVESGHIFPAQLEKNRLSKISNTIFKFFNNLNISNSLGHTEFIFEKETNDIYIIESHLRAGGDCIPDLVEEVSGFNPYYLFFKAIDKEKVPEFNYEGQAAIYYFIPRIGEITQVTFETQEGFKDIHIKDRLDFTNKKVGKILNSFDRKWGYIILSGNDLQEKARKYFDTIHIKYEGDRRMS